MPRAAVGRFWEWVDAQAAKVRPWTPEQRAFAERTFRAVLVDAGPDHG